MKRKRCIHPSRTTDPGSQTSHRNVRSQKEAQATPPSLRASDQKTMVRQRTENGLCRDYSNRQSHIVCELGADKLTRKTSLPGKVWLRSDHEMFESTRGGCSSVAAVSRLRVSSMMAMVTLMSLMSPACPVMLTIAVTRSQERKQKDIIGK